MNKNYIYYKLLIKLLITISFLQGEMINHQSESQAIFHSPLDLQVFTDYSDNEIKNLNVYIKNDNQIVYLINIIRPNLWIVDLCIHRFP